MTICNLRAPLTVRPSQWVVWGALGVARKFPGGGVARSTMKIVMLHNLSGRNGVRSNHSVQRSAFPRES